LNNNRSLYLSARFITYLVDFLLDQGIDPKNYIDGYDLEQTTHELSFPLDVEYISILFESMSKKLSNPCLGFDLANTFHYENSSIIVKAMLSSRSVHDFFNTVVKYDKYIDSALELNFSFNTTEACFDIEVFAPKNVDTIQITLYLISFILLTLKKITRIDIPLTRIDFVNKAVADIISDKLTFKDVEINYHCARNKLFFNSDFLKNKLYSSNSLLHEILSSALDHHFSSKNTYMNIIDVVRREILMQNYHSIADISSVSRGLNITERTLHRRLAEHDMTFKKLKQQTILERSMYYLSNTQMTIGEISYEVGYSETSAFCRAFKRFYQKSPQDFRIDTSELQQP
jgi:AraC-like DNA-binding protein